LNFGADVCVQFATEGGHCECIYRHSASIPCMGCWLAKERRGRQGYDRE
jgi:hypothetical protein